MKTVFGAVYQFLRKTECVGSTDSQLLETYLSQREGAAFAALVQRHGPMVWGVCRRLLPTTHDAEDAYQATFLVLVRKAASVWPREQLGAWLHGVAYLTARHARKLALRRLVWEKPLDELLDGIATPAKDLSELRALLDQELQALPEKYRTPLVLCDLEGRTRREAAAQLGCPEGTVAGRLSRARTLLARRLSRYGPLLLTPALAGFLATEAAAADTSPTWMVQNLHQSSAVFTLTEGVLHTMKMSQWKAATMVLLSASVFLLSLGLLAAPVFATKPPPSTVANTVQPATNNDPDSPLAKLIAKVEANEKLYRNIEATWGHIYRSPNASLDNAITRSKTRNHCILQNDLLWVTNTQEYETANGKKGTWESVYGYDGETTRRFEYQQGTVMPGRGPEPFHLFRPHTLLLEMNTITKLPLSVLLRNGRELQNVWPGMYRDKEHVITLVGEEKIDDIACLKLNIEVWGGKEKRSLFFRRHLWLCPERNYLPVKLDSYISHNSQDKAMECGEVTAWQELAAGLWLPRSWNFNRYHDEILRQQGKQLVQIMQHHDLETVKLNPTYDKKFFQDVKFPANVTVKELNAQGETIKTYPPGTYKPME